MDELRYDASFMGFEPLEGKVNQLPMDHCSWINGPLKFVVKVLEIWALSGCIDQGMLEALDYDSVIDTWVGKACSVVWIVRKVKGIGWRGHL